MKRALETARTLAEATKDDAEIGRASRKALHAIQKIMLLGRYRDEGEPEGPLANSEDIDGDKGRIGPN